ncbi:MAG: homoserine dehydrogenase [Anaerolineae bacterium]|nr:homoserine dehydrogenase [Anaerolineae bacterium]
MGEQQVRLVLIGLGNIGRRFLDVLRAKDAHLRAAFGLAFRVVGAADSRGAAIDPAGLDLDQVIAHKAAGRSVSTLPGAGRPGLSAHDLVCAVDAEALCEASPVNLAHGEPGLSCMRAAMRRGMHVVTPNKGPLVLAYGELSALARAQGVQLRFCGAVAGGLPAINIGQRDLAGATIDRLEALPNLTTSFILDKMAGGMGYAEALAAAQAQGCAEADPTLDVEGWDAANKLVILANSVLGMPATLADVDVTGITGVTPSDLAAARAAGQAIKLVASAVRQAGGGYALTVAPTPLPADHPLAQLSGQQMGIVYHTDIYGTISAAILEETPVPSAATMLRDLLNIYT